VRITIDADRCAGHAQCYFNAPELFTVDDQGNGVVLAEEVVESMRDLALRAVMNCPEQAIRIED
jgi:ferredoxin